jgi:AcrR family transcriptional regulator
VAKSTVYRRYPSKEDLIMAARELCTSCPTEPVDTGSIESDFLEIARNLRSTYTSTDVGRALPATLMASAKHPGFARAHRAFIAEKRSLVKGSIRRGIDRGELPRDTDAELLMDLVCGPIFYRVFNTGGAVDDDALRALVVAALRSAGASPIGAPATGTAAG